MLFPRLLAARHVPLMTLPAAEPSKLLLLMDEIIAEGVGAHEVATRVVAARRTRGGRTGATSRARRPATLPPAAVNFYLMGRCITLMTQTKQAWLAQSCLQQRGLCCRIG